MKNFNTTKINSLLKQKLAYFIVALAFCLMPFTAKADIINLNANTTESYLMNGTSNVVIYVSFSSNTVEYADKIEFILPGGASSTFSLSHGIPSPSPFTACQENNGDESTIANGISWLNPSFPNGGSHCGAFVSDVQLKFGIAITHTSASGSALNLTVRLTGDGYGESAPSVASTIVQILPANCVVNCPSDVVAYANQGSCGANVNIPLPTSQGSCTVSFQDLSGYYAIGTHELSYTSSSGSTCHFTVTVIDDTNPIINNCANMTFTLENGECSVYVPDFLDATDDCSNVTTTMSQNFNFSTINSGPTCNNGETKYYRIFNTTSYNINTYYNVSSIELAIYQAYNFPNIGVNLYKYSGDLNPVNMELVAGTTMSVPNTTQDFLTVPISAQFEAGDQIALEVIVPGSNFSGFVLGFNDSGETSPSYISSVTCNTAIPVTVESIGFNADAMMRLHGTESPTRLYKTFGNYDLDGDFPIGVHNLTYEAIDASGNKTQCSFTITVNPVQNPLTAMGCNDLINIVLDEDCTAVVLPDELLEGGPYPCYDSFSVHIEDLQGNDIGNTVDGSHVGQTLTATVKGPNGNSCWSKIFVEDKLAPNLECNTVYTSCSGDLSPGSPLGTMLAFPANILAGTIENNFPNSHEYYIDVFGLNGASITDLNVELGIEHSQPSDLIVLLEGPQGQAIKLFDQIAQGCTGDNLMVTMDDEAFNTYADLQTFCENANPAVSGRFVPYQSLSAFDGTDPNGQWKITVTDINSTDGGKVNSIKLVFMQSGAIMSFPTTNDITWNQINETTFTVYGIDNCTEATLQYNDQVVEETCSSIYTKVIARTWLATDIYGNQSTPCVQTIYVYRNGLATLTWPPNYDGVQNNALSCSDWGTSVPDPNVTGYPTGDLCDNVQIFDPEDTRIDICPKSYKIIRKWKVLEWCTSEIREHNQIIKIVDEQGPEIECPDDLVLSADSENCSTTVAVPKPTVISECSDNVTYTLQYLPVTLNGAPTADDIWLDDNVINNTAISDVPFGDTWVKWTVMDECGNRSECWFTVTIVDNVPPIAVCDQHTKVAIGSDGYAKVFATTFDDGSVDNCNIDRFAVRKMTDICGISGTGNFTDDVTFCCSEIGKTIMVEFKVWDKAGNSNSCMVEVEVEDKLPPYITDCPEDITLDCQSDYTDLDVTGRPIAIDNCNVEDIYYEDSGSINNCGRGTITRTWTVVDGQGFKNSCIQYITLKDLDPFNSSDIRWPLDYTATTCGTNLDPENLPSGFDYPKIDDDICALTAATYKDQVFNFVEGSCEKILRTWTVIDWCTYDENNPQLGVGYFQHLQVIKLQNTIAPTILSSCTDVMALSYGNCGDNITLTIDAEDDCTEKDDLVYQWIVDVNNDGIADAGYSGTGRTMTKYYKNGTHKIIWKVEDKCGNVSTCSYLFTVKDGKKPTPYCRSSVTTVVMNNNGMVEIWATDYELGSYDNCTPYDKLRFSFSSNVNQKSLVFTCADIPDGISATIPVEMWVTDEAGNQDFCSVNIELQDNLGDACEDQNGLFTISGRVLTENSDIIDNITTSISSSQPEFPKVVSPGSNGSYLFNGLKPNYDYTVGSSKVDDVMNGVSTLDIVLIQRHILGISELNTPYKKIASDINNDGKITAADLIKLRKLILGLTTDFDSGQHSYRFVTKTNGFNNASNPFPFNETYLQSNLTNNVSGKDFVAVKIGDVNSSAVFNARN
ncbi:MAG TPA: HYR domain-containing protein, partial [Saprospiraceae bacterium]|nr:HYR domain-containing protein [Saprospiraceae bacterium]